MEVGQTAPFGESGFFAFWNGNELSASAPAIIRAEFIKPTAPADSMSDVIRILSAIEQGDPHATEQLMPLVYEELRKLAAQRLAQEKPGQTLDATGLVHEAYLRLVGAERDPTWNSRGHFFAAAAEAMRRILVENARRKKRLRHGGDSKRVEVELTSLPTRMSSDELVALDEALEKLANKIQSRPAYDAAILWRHDHRTGAGSTWDLSRHRPSLLDVRSCLAPRADDSGR